MDWFNGLSYLRIFKKTHWLIGILPSLSGSRVAFFSPPLGRVPLLIGSDKPNNCSFTET